MMSLKGTQKLSKKEQSQITGSHRSGCTVNGSGSTGQSCTTASQCRPLFPGFPVACFQGCCISAF